MNNKVLAAALAAITFGSAVIPSSSVLTQAADSYDLSVNVNLYGTHKSISPYIYGINDAGYLDDVTATAVRQGGNRYSGYNWENNYSNAGSDWQHSSDTYLTSGYSSSLASTPGACPIHLSQDAQANNVDYKVATIQMAGYVSADKNGSVSTSEAPPSSRWKEVVAKKGSAFSLAPDTTDNYVYMDEYVNYLVQTLGDSTTATGIQAYNLDNEPSLWSSTHSIMHPNQATCEEIVSKSTEFSSAIKAVDPNAEVFGLALFGVGAYISFSGASDWESTYSSQYDWFVSYYLDKMQDAENAAGKRLIDAIDLHYYSEDTGQCRVTNCTDNSHTSCVQARLQAPRSLYDSTYIENSWIGQWCSQYLPVLPKVQDSIDTYYPGTKLAMTEYNFGGGNHISGAIAQADALGAFASNDVYIATLWPLTDSIDYQLSAIDLYTNYDGNGSSFGDTLVPSSTSDITKATSYASINGSDASRVTMVLTNKCLDQAQNATINLSSDADYSSATVYGITSDSSEIQFMQTIDNIENNSFTIQIPALSVVQVEIVSDGYVMLGDADNNGTVDIDDAKLMKDYIHRMPDAVVVYPQTDMNENGYVEIVDYLVLTRRLNAYFIPEEIDQPFEELDTAKWKIKDGVGGKTVTCTLNAQANYKASLGYGYWDPVAINETTGEAGVWVQNSDTSLGSVSFNDDGVAKLSFDVPANAQSLQIEVYYYAYYDKTSGADVECDKSAVSLSSVTYH